MNIRQLEAFRTTMMVGTVNGAADLLGLSQPSVSRLITELEKELGVTLFNRAAGRLVPTPEGRMIHEQVENTFRAYQRIGELAADVRKLRVGSISIACMPALGISFLPAVIARFCEAHPDVDISLDVQSSTKVEDWIATERIDLGLAEVPYDREDLSVDEFCNVPYYAVMKKGDQLGEKSMLSPADFEGRTFISTTAHYQARPHVDRLFESRGIHRVMRIDTSFSHSTCELAALGMGVGFIDPFSVHGYLDRVEVRLVDPCITFRVGLLYPRSRPLSKVGRTFVSFMKECRDRWFAEVAAACKRHV
ncbi:LysR family transcriptional regulator [Trinickia symbiotica]|uniref:LysR family transcriptional regulator n=1 Tax=Trinickia symbiotica TaxID=863227 RepID=A0A2T3XL37_9BURK|nr:LysR substrate-binding domain-containing protein [Trinickia symbiotica]PTB17233.1 LysR family transcriptional regulator [Trinickia symbiotica]